MIDGLYVFLSKLGYHHPIHPTEVHISIGLVAWLLSLHCLRSFSTGRSSFSPPAKL
jgi:uncharacterized membrane protein